MPARRLPLLVALLAALLVVAYVSGAFDRDPSTVDVPQLDIPADQADRIELSGALDLALVRADSVWTVVQPSPSAADSAVVARLVTSLGDLRLASLVTTNPDRHSQYGMDSTATRVEVSWESGAVVLVVSKRGPDWSSSYIRLGDGDEVYATRSKFYLPLSVESVRAEEQEGSPSS